MIGVLAAALASHAGAEPEKGDRCQVALDGEVRVGLRGPTPILERLGRLDATRNAERRAALAQLFQQVGCPEIRDAPYDQRTPGNLVCRLPGRLSRRILVGAHFDKRGAGRGIVDNWSGAAMLASLVESLLPVERRHELLFVGFSEEEKGLVGSRAWVRQMSPRDREALAAMVNIDSIGMGPLRVEKRYSDERLMCAFAIGQALARQPAEALTFGMGISSDFAPFRSAGFPTLNLTSYHREWQEILHQRRDQLKEIDRDAYYASYRSIAITLGVLDAVLSRDEATTASHEPADGAASEGRAR